MIHSSSLLDGLLQLISQLQLKALHNSVARM